MLISGEVAFWSAALTKVTRFITEISLSAHVALWLVIVTALMVISVPSSLNVTPEGGAVGFKVMVA